MNDIVLVAQVCMYNEVEKGNLDRCLDNLIKYCDRVVIYDDASTDDSVVVAEKYGAHVIRGEVNDQMQELAHKQIILEKSLEMGATHLFWLDCDEVLDRAGTLGGIRNLCQAWPEDLDAYSFRELNLWRSQTWVRQDTLFSAARFVRLWKVVPGIEFNVQDGVHKQLFPKTIKNIAEAPFGIIHYGFCNYKKMMVKIGAHLMDQGTLQKCAEEGIEGREPNWILDERGCSCQRLPNDEYPPGCLPPNIWEKPLPRTNLIPYVEVPGEVTFPLIDSRGLNEWAALHEKKYHGDYESILTRNRNIMTNAPIDPWNRSSLFKFDPAGKSIIDLACGGGWFMLDCIKNGASKVLGLDIDDILLSNAAKSYQELGIIQESYEFLNITNGVNSLPTADIIYAMALFMHLPFWQNVRYFKWIYEMLADDGEAHLQFHQAAPGNVTLLWNNFDNVSTVRLDHELERAGLIIKEKRLAEGEGIEPVWQLYTCVKGLS